MRKWLLAACLVAGASPPVLAQEDDTVGAIQNDYYSTLSTNSRKAQEAQQKAPQGIQLPLLSEAELQGFLERCWKIYDTSAGEPAEFEALNQVLTLAAAPYVQPTSEKSLQAWRDAAAKLFADFLDDDRMAGLVLNFPAPAKAKKEVDDYVKKLAGSKSVAVKAAAAFAPLSARADAAADAPLSPDAEAKLCADIEAFAAEHGALAQVRGGTYAEWAKNTTHALKNLKIGGVAPEIAGPDLDGVNFKLSDYRGKVVLLDFWGYW